MYLVIASTNYVRTGINDMPTFLSLSLSLSLSLCTKDLRGNYRVGNANACEKAMKEVT